MKTTRNVLFALLLLGGTAGAARAATSVSAGVHIGPSGRTSVDLGFFYDDLAPYGNWIERPSHGWVWTPSAVATSWRPYQDGRWVWTDEGWVWDSYEPYGWATYHYGRWYDDPEVGWAWVPGNDWGPAWVSWQGGSDYVGWAPLPPGVSISASYGSGYGDYAYGIAPQDYVFVPERNFLAPRLSAYIVPEQQIFPIYRQTRNWTNYRYSGGRYFNQGVPIDQIQRFNGGRVPRYQVADLGFNEAKRLRRAQLKGNQIAFFRPQVQKAARIAPPISRPAARRAVMSAAQFKAAHPNRVARMAMNQRLARQERQVRVDQRQAQLGRQQLKVDRRQAQISRQQVKVDRRQAQAARQGVRQNGKAMAQRQAQAAQQRQQRMNVQQRQARVQQRQIKVDQRQARVNRQQVRVDRQRQQQASFRQHEKAAVRQRQQVRVDQRQARVDRQQVRVDRQRQAQSFRQQQKAAPQRQQQAQQRQARQAQQAQRFQARQQPQRQRAANRPPGGGGGRHNQGGQGNPRRQRGGPGQ